MHCCSEHEIELSTPKSKFVRRLWRCAASPSITLCLFFEKDQEPTVANIENTPEPSASFMGRLMPVFDDVYRVWSKNHRQPCPHTVHRPFNAHRPSLTLLTSRNKAHMSSLRHLSMEPPGGNPGDLNSQSPAFVNPLPGNDFIW